MSRMGNKPVAIADSVNVELKSDIFTAKGPKGELSLGITGDVKVEITDGNVVVTPANDSKRARAMWGTTRSNINNLIVGVKEGYTKKLIITGVGYKAQVQGKFLRLSLGYSHEILYAIPDGIEMKVGKEGKDPSVEITGASGQQVGQVAAEIRALRKPEPYKGKGVRYADEKIRRKEGKKK